MERLRQNLFPQIRYKREKLRLMKIELSPGTYILESSPANCPEKCMETNLVDDDEEIDNSFKPSTLRRSFRRMRKAVK